MLTTRYSPRSSVPRGNNGGLAALEKFLIGRTIDRNRPDARVLKRFVEPAANCALCTTGLEKLSTALDVDVAHGATLNPLDPGEAPRTFYTGEAGFRRPQ